jgi:hypothetical protein
MARIDIFYQGERVREIEHTEADANDTVGVLKARLTEKHCADANALLFLEDGEDPLDEAVAIGTVAGPAGAKLHLHRCRRVEIAVTFVGETVTQPFGPGATVASVKRWAAQRNFGMTEEEAGEHLLQIAGTHDRPAPGTHVGTLAACPACRIAFDLVPDERVNGAPCGCVHGTR